MGKGTAFLQALLGHIFQGGLAVSIPNPDLYISLHTATPDGGSQLTDEVTYTGYSRVAVARDPSEFTVVDGVVNPVSAISFPKATAVPGTETAKYWAIGTTASSAGMVLYTGPISPFIHIDAGVTPTLLPTSFVSET